MNVDLQGRVDNLSLAASNALMPVFEAVVNSIQAIEDNAKGSNGKIEIKILRDKSTQTEMGVGEKAANLIIGFEIIDNGIGFNEINFKSFDTSDSRLKEARGGKGIGRLFWLKAFDRAEVRSNFTEKSEAKNKSFNFTLNGIEPVQEVPANSSGTTVRLLGFKDYYRKGCPKRAQSIANKIVEHCLIYFLDPHCPKILVTDDDEGTKINLNSWYKDNVGQQLTSKTFELSGESFEIIVLPLYGTSETANRLHWCSSNREVFNESLFKILPDLKGKQKTNEGKSFILFSYLKSTFLDKHTNAERTGFVIEEDVLPIEGEMDPDAISLKRIRQKLGEVLGSHLKDTLEPIAKEKKEYIQKYVQEIAPQYRSLIKLEPQILDEIPPGLSDEKLDIELHQAHYKLERRVKEEGQNFVKSVIENPNMQEEERQKKEEAYFEKVSSLSQSNLAKYVVSRKAILEIFDRIISQKLDGKFERESAVHNLIFPQRKTSGEVGYKDHNLWLIDERLSYHYYLASDKSLKSHEVGGSDSLERPDLVVYNQPNAFVEGEVPFSSVVVIEFKKPGRDDNDKGNRDPIQQMFDYIEEIKAGKRRSADGQQFAVPANIPFFAYLICDLTDDIHKIAKGKTLKPSSDGLGYFGYNDNYSTYVEVISYKKITVDARKRNRAFFDKLGL